MLFFYNNKNTKRYNKPIYKIARKFSKKNSNNKHFIKEIQKKQKNTKKNILHNQKKICTFANKYHNVF